MSAELTVWAEAGDLAQTSEVSLRDRLRDKYAASIPQYNLLLVDTLEPLLPANIRVHPELHRVALLAEMKYGDGEAVLALRLGGYVGAAPFRSGRTSDEPVPAGREFRRIVLVVRSNDHE